MATVRLGRYEARQGHLPPVCLSCGIAAGVFRSLRVIPVYWLFLILFPPIGLPALVIVYCQSPLVRAPLCEFHRYHWRWRNGVILLGMLLSIFLTTQSFFDRSGWDGRLVSGIVFVPAITFLLAIVFRYNAIHSAGIKNVSIKLRRVSPEFIEAHRVQCHDDWGTDDSSSVPFSREPPASAVPPNS